MLNGRHHGEGEHDKRDVTMPAVPRSGLVMVEPELVLGGLEAVLDRPTMALDADQRRDRCSGRAPGGEVGKIAVGNIAPYQQAARPQAMIFNVELFSLKIGQFEVAPVMQPRPFGSRASRQALPIECWQCLGDLLGGAAKQPLLVP